MASQAKTPWRVVLTRALAAVVVALAVSAHMAAPAHAIENLRKYAGIVVDAKSNQVLYEENADSKRYPASVAKVMTLYVLFQELSAGNLKLSTKMTVSRHAAAAVPTKLGLRAGSEITVEDAIKSLVTLSANDMARVIAENISGSEEKFAERMTATARAMGMRNTTYRNASGLPDGGQTTTVRDQAILAIAIYQHFPNYYEFFQTRSFNYGKSTYGNHNRVLGYMGAVDGIKTGYINAAGSNLMTAARKDGRHIVIIAFGFNSAGSRDQKVRELVAAYLPKGRSGNYVAQVPIPGRQGNVQVAVAQSAPAAGPVFVMPMPMPGFRLAQLAAANSAPPQAMPQVVVASTSPQPAPMPADLNQQAAVQAANTLAAPSQAPQPAYPSQDIIGAWLSESYNLGAPPSALGQTAPSAPLGFQPPPANVGGDQAQQPVDLMTSGSVQTAAAVGGWVVQIGAGPSEDSARAMLSDAAGKVGNLGDFRSYVERFDKNGQTFFRARFVGFGDRDDATAMCNQLKQQDMSCLAMQS